MATKLQIINAALQNLGANPITTLGEGTEEDIFIDDIYDLTVEQVMIEASWMCLRKRVSLTAVDETPAFNYSNVFQLPADNINIIQFNENVNYVGDPIRYGIIPGVVRGPRRYTVEGDKLLTNETRADIVYIARNTDEADWDPHLTQTVKAALKVEIAKHYSATESTVGRLLQEYEILLRRNRARNNQQSGSEELYTNTYLEGR